MRNWWHLFYWFSLSLLPQPPTDPCFFSQFIGASVFPSTLIFYNDMSCIYCNPLYFVARHTMNSNSDPSNPVYSLELSLTSNLHFVSSLFRNAYDSDITSCTTSEALLRCLVILDYLSHWRMGAKSSKHKGSAPELWTSLWGDLTW